MIVTIANPKGGTGRIVKFVVQTRRRPASGRAQVRAGGALGSPPATSQAEGKRCAAKWSGSV